MSQQLEIDKHSNEKVLPQPYPLKAIIKVGEGRGFNNETVAMEP